jgi:hypothetical protein
MMSASVGLPTHTFVSLLWGVTLGLSTPEGGAVSTGRASQSMGRGGL